MSAIETVTGVYRLDCFGGSAVAGYSGRNLDNSKRQLFLGGLGLKIEDLVMVQQVHGAEVLRVDHPASHDLESPADGLITDKKGVVLGIRTADCVPIFFADERGRAVGIAHGGWKGVKQGIVPNMIDVFQSHYGILPGDLSVAFGPAIRACCYEVGPEFSRYFPGCYHAAGSGKGRLDLVEVIRRQLASSGIGGERIHDTGICTACRNDAFFSYRREHLTPERMLNVISLVC